MDRWLRPPIPPVNIEVNFGGSDPRVYRQAMLLGNFVISAPIVEDFMAMKIRHIPKRDIPPQNFDLTRPWSVDCTLLAPDPTGYQAVIVDEADTPVARSLREPAPIDYANRRFNFVFVPPIHLDYDAHSYRVVIEGPSGIRIPFEGLSIPRTHGIVIGCYRCKGTGTTTDTKMQCPECFPTRNDGAIPF